MYCSQMGNIPEQPALDQCIANDNNNQNTLAAET